MTVTFGLQASAQVGKQCGLPGYERLMPPNALSEEFAGSWTLRTGDKTGQVNSYKAQYGRPASVGRVGQGRVSHLATDCLSGSGMMLGLSAYPSRPAPAEPPKAHIRPGRGPSARAFSVKQILTVTG